MVLAYGALKKENEQLKETLDEKNKIVNQLIESQKRNLLIEKKKAIYYKKEDTLQKKINLQLHNLIQSLFILSCPIKAPVSPLFWGHQTIKKENVCKNVDKVSVKTLLKSCETQPVDPPVALTKPKEDKHSANSFVTRMFRAASRLETVYGGAPPPSIRPTQSVVPADFSDLWTNVLSLDSCDPPIDISPTPPPTKPRLPPHNRSWIPLPPRPFSLESRVQPRPRISAPRYWPTLASCRDPGCSVTEPVIRPDTENMREYGSDNDIDYEDIVADIVANDYEKQQDDDNFDNTKEDTNTENENDYEEFETKEDIMSDTCMVVPWSDSGQVMSGSESDCPIEDLVDNSEDPDNDEFNDGTENQDDDLENPDNDANPWYADDPIEDADDPAEEEDPADEADSADVDTSAEDLIEVSGSSLEDFPSDASSAADSYEDTEGSTDYSDYDPL